MLAVPAGELRDPVAFFIRMKADDRALNARIGHPLHSLRRFHLA
jgi:hypothetical protein